MDEQYPRQSELGLKDRLMTRFWPGKIAMDAQAFLDNEAVNEGRIKKSETETHQRRSCIALGAVIVGICVAEAAHVSPVDLAHALEDIAHSI